ncbi:hypothetical protein R6Q57_000988 [Mikania cordata]
MADVARSHGGDGGNEPPYGPPYNLRTGCESSKPAKKRSHGKNLNLYEKFQKNGSMPLPLEFDYSSNQFRAVGENYQFFVRLVSNEVDRHAPFHYRSWQELPGEIKMFILTTLHFLLLCNYIFSFCSTTLIVNDITTLSNGKALSKGSNRIVQTVIRIKRQSLKNILTKLEITITLKEQRKNHQRA